MLLNDEAKIVGEATRMASVETQRNFTGNRGEVLLGQTLKLRPVAGL